MQESAIFFILGLFCVICPQSVLAEEFNMNSMPPPEMHMEYSAGALKDGGKITVSITVPDKWHVNANKVTDEFLKPSSIEAKAEGIEFGDAVWPAPIREYNEADRRGEIPRSFKNLVSRLQGVLSRGVTFSDIDNLESSVGWDPEKALEWYNRCRRDVEAKDIIRNGFHASGVRYDMPHWEILGLDGRRWDKWRQNQCYCPQDIVDAVYAAMPVDGSYIQRLCALLSEREPDKWTAMGGG